MIFISSGVFIFRFLFYYTHNKYSEALYDLLIIFEYGPSSFSSLVAEAKNHKLSIPESYILILDDLIQKISDNKIKDDNALAISLIKNNDYKSCLELLLNKTRHQPQNSYIHFMLACCFCAVKKSSSALEQIQICNKMKPNNNHYKVITEWIKHTSSNVTSDLYNIFFNIKNEYIKGDI